MCIQRKPNIESIPATFQSDKLIYIVNWMKIKRWCCYKETKDIKLTAKIFDVSGIHDY